MIFEFRWTEAVLTSRSLLSTCMYLSMKSRIVSQRAVKVGRDKRGVRWWRNTLDRTVAALMRVSSMPEGSCGLTGSSSLASRGNRTLLKHDSHSAAVSVCRSWNSSALWRYAMAFLCTCMEISVSSKFVSFQVFIATSVKVGGHLLRCSTMWSPPALRIKPRTSPI